MRLGQAYQALTPGGSIVVDETQIFGGGTYGAYTIINGQVVDIMRADPIGDWRALLAKGFQGGSGWQLPSLIDSLANRAAASGQPDFNWGRAIATLLQSNAATYGRIDMWTEGSPAPSILDDILAVAKAYGLGPAPASSAQMNVNPAEKAAAIQSMQQFQASQGDDGINPLVLVALAVVAYYGAPYLLQSLGAAAPTATAAATEAAIAEAAIGLEAGAGWEAALATGWESAAATSAVQNVAIAEVTGQVAAGTLAQTIGAEAAASVLAEAVVVVEGGIAAGAGAELEASFDPGGELAAEPVPSSPSVDIADLQTPPKEILETGSTAPPPEIPATKSAITEYLPKIFKAGQALYQYAVKQNAGGAPTLAARQVGQLSLNGEPVFFQNTGTTVPRWMLAAGVGAGLLAASSLFGR